MKKILGWIDYVEDGCEISEQIIVDVEEPTTEPGNSTGRMVRTAEAARILGVPEYTIREAVKRGKLKPANSRRDGKRRQHLFDRHDLDKEKLML